MSEKKIEFIENDLIDRIIKSNDDLKNQTLIRKTVKAKSSLDGFMSTIITVELEMR